MQSIIKQFIIETLESVENEANIEPREDKLLAEPDFSADEADAEEKYDEVSAVGGVGGAGPSIAGFTLPLGMKPPGQKRQPAYKVAGKAFGNAKLTKKK